MKKKTMILIDFLKYELRNRYKLDKNITLIILMYEKLSNISSERNIQYELYESLNLTKLDLSVCKDLSIDIYVPLTISEKLQSLYGELKDLGYDLFDINNIFYQDICTPYKSENGTDVLLTDRINNYYNNDETKCQSNCKFSDYYIKAQYLKCECDVNNSEIQTEDNKKFNPKNIYKSFYDVLKFSNYKVLKCYKLVFKIDSITNNIGSIIAIVYAFIYIMFIILYLIKGNNEIKKFITMIKKKKQFVKYNAKINQKNKFRNSQMVKFPEKNTKTKNKIKKENKKRKSIKRPINKNNNYPPKKNSMIIFNNQNISIRNKNNIKIINNNSFLKRSKSELIKYDSQLQNLKYINQKNENKINFNAIKKEKLDNYELNNLEYERAKQLDKRKLIDIYWSVLNREHLILSTFCNKNDYNIIYIKFARLIFLICTDMALNVFFGFKCIFLF